MLFNSFPFLILFLPLVLCITKPLKGQTLMRALALSSYVFYALFGQAWFLVPMFLTTVLDYFLAQRIERVPSRSIKRILLGISLIGNLGVLFYFKYSAFISDTLLSLSPMFHLTDASARWPLAWRALLPAGISFYTFQTLSYVIDVYKGEAPAEYNFPKFAAFVSFFPHLVAGPLTRHHQLLPSLEKVKENGIVRHWDEGVYLFVIGLAKKTLLADPIAHCIDPLLTDVSSLTCFSSWVVLLGYALQIYFDFSGYCDMAIGLGRLFGIELPQNFNSPYQAKNPSDFWRRWHITLSLWMRDYVYIPLKGNGRSLTLLVVSLILTMFLGGLWHGAKWTYAVWGLYHGGLLALYHLSKTRWDRWPDWFQRLLCFFLVCLGWVFFRAASMKEARQWMRHLSGFARPDGAISDSVLWPLGAYVLGGLLIVNCLSPASPPFKLRDLTPRMQVGMGILALMAILFMDDSSKFLYFQF